MEKQYFHFPRWITGLYVISALILIPWTFYIADNLPQYHIAQHWDLAWAGFDVFMIVLLLITIFFAVRRKIWLSLSATALATVLVVDAWFDVLTARPGHQQKDAILFAVLIEVPIAIITYIYAARSVARLHRRIEKLK